MKKKVELVFIPLPGLIGHLVSTMEIAKLLVDRNDQLSITFLIMKLPFDSMVVSYIDSQVSSSITQSIRFIHLPQQDVTLEFNSSFIYLFLEHQKPYVRDAIAKLTWSNSTSNPDKIAGIVVDMFCATMIDVASEFGIPSYIFLTSSASFLGLMFHFQTLLDHHNKNDFNELNDLDSELLVPCFANLVPAKVLPPMVLDMEYGLNLARSFRETKGIIINTFIELESHAINFISNNTTLPIYPVGPILNFKGDGRTHQNSEIMKWLDDQPPSSVVFLCFGSMGSFGEDQVKEISCGLEHSGHRFLWSLRRPPPKDGLEMMPSDYTNLNEVLPDGFLERTARIGLVIGWAPQMAILAHQAIGGFVSHCGWNSILVSLWYGIPIATWPIFGEQQLNAFEIVRELALAADIRLNYMQDFEKNSGGLVMAEEIERGIKSLMDGDSEVRKNVKIMKEKSTKAMMDGGSSYTSLGRLIEDVMNNIS